MTELGRRGFLTSAVLGGVALGVGGTGTAAAEPAAADGTGCGPDFGPVTVTPADPRYPSLLDVYNTRYTPKPGAVRLAGSTEQVVAVVNEAVAAGKRIVPRSGGHCFENFTSSPDVEVLLDLSQLSEIHHDTKRNAIAVGTGATLGQVYRTLFKRWGITIPGGSCFAVGAGGHFAGGGYGHLSRRYGMVSDHLYAVEVVVVDQSGKARAVVATREPDDPNRDLWWAHSGGGGGNFGVVTRYWLRSPGVTSTDPGQLMPKGLRAGRRRNVTWSWDTLTEAALTKIIRNFSTWYERNSAPGTPATKLWSVLNVSHRSAGEAWMVAVIDDDVPGADALLNSHVDAVLAGTGVKPVSDAVSVVPWMTQQGWPPDEVNGRYKHKAGDLRKGFDDAQLATIYRHIGSTDYTNPAAFFSLNGYGGQVNAPAPDATATATRDAVLRAVFSTGMWESAADDARHLAWVRKFYREVYATTGGVPVPGETNAGCYINYADNDLADPSLNTSGVGWQTLYYKGNYPRLQQIKKRYDPRNIFHHTLSIELPG